MDIVGFGSVCNVIERVCVCVCCTYRGRAHARILYRPFIQPQIANISEDVHTHMHACLSKVYTHIYDGVDVHRINPFNVIFCLRFE